jgi:hypothetical protein
VKICKHDGIPLVNVVRRQEQVDLLRSIGMQVNSQWAGNFAVITIGLNHSKLGLVFLDRFYAFVVCFDGRMILTQRSTALAMQCNVK